MRPSSCAAPPTCWRSRRQRWRRSSRPQRCEKVWCGVGRCGGELRGPGVGRAALEEELKIWKVWGGVGDGVLPRWRLAANQLNPHAFLSPAPAPRAPPPCPAPYRHILNEDSSSHPLTSHPLNPHPPFFPPGRIATSCLTPLRPHPVPCTPPPSRVSSGSKLPIPPPRHVTKLRRAPPRHAWTSAQRAARQQGWR